jgi:hypothetical protein
VDGRNCLDRTVLEPLGFEYHSMGQPSSALHEVGVIR